MKKIRIKRFRTLKRTIEDPARAIKVGNILNWLIFFGVLTALYWVFSSSFFTIKNIECDTQNKIPCDQNILAEIETHKGSLIFTTNTKSIEEKIKKADPIYSGLKIIAILPNTLKISMDRINYFANLKVSTDSASLIVDINKVVIDKQPSPTPGTFSIISSTASQYSVGDKISDPNTLLAFKIADELKRNYLTFTQINILSPTEITVDLNDDKTAILTSTQDMSRQVTSLQLILSKATISPEPQIFDMRFGMPVLKY